jgi:hypothetical protein
MNDASDSERDQNAGMAFDWLIRVCVPAFLRLAKFDEHAGMVEALPLFGFPDLGSAKAALRGVNLEVDSKARALGISEGGLPHDAILRMVGPRFLTIWIWGIADTAAAIALDIAASEEDRKEVAAKIAETKERLARELEGRLLA